METARLLDRGLLENEQRPWRRLGLCCADAAVAYLVEADAMTARLLVGDCLEIMRTMPSESIDAVVTDPPAGISFMNTTWDHHKGGRDTWIAWLTDVMREALRLAKPGAHAFVWALPRTSGWTHRAIEDAGWEIRDCATHIFGSGFPKSKNLDGEWEGWGTALKPAAEFWYLARKPLSGSVAANVTAWGVGGLNIDGCRIDTNGETWSGPKTISDYDDSVYALGMAKQYRKPNNPQGRWPANLILDAESAALLDELSGERTSPSQPVRQGGHHRHDVGLTGDTRQGFGVGYGDSGGASRFFYTAKASRAERNKGLDGMPEQQRRSYEGGPIVSADHPKTSPGGHTKPASNHHPTVKSVDLMQWLVRLITPKGGTVLDCFCGSGSTGIAADREGFNSILIDREPEYIEIARRRIIGDAPLFAEVVTP